MSPVTFLWLAVGGGVGAVCRLLLDGVVRSRSRGTLPWGTIVINLSGSLALGLLTGLAADLVVSDAWKLVIGTGFLGGYTTFSTASFETVRLVQERKYLPATINGLGVIVATTALAGLGLWLGGLAR